MTELTEKEREYLDNKFENFKLSFWKRFRLSALGLAVVFGAAVAVFATYTYLQAKINVINSQAELVKATVTFYRGMEESNKEMKDMMEKFNVLVEQAGTSVVKMYKYEKQLEEIVKRHERLKAERPVGHPKTPETDALLKELAQPSAKVNKSTPRDMFKINPNIKQQIAQ